MRWVVAVCRTNRCGTMSRTRARFTSVQINESNAISLPIYCQILCFLSVCLSFTVSSCFHYGIFCLSVVLFISISSVPLCRFVYVLFQSVCMQSGKWIQGVCVYKHQSASAVYLFVWVCVVAVHASLWDALISAHSGSAPSCPCGWPLIETNQARDGPIAVTPHPSHPRPNHLLIGPRGAPLPLARKVNLTGGWRLQEGIGTCAGWYCMDIAKLSITVT